MPDGFEQMVDEALGFFAELEQNNTKAWFEPHKARYKDQIAGPAGFFADLLAEDIARQAMAIAADICVYTNGNLTVETLDA